MNVRNWRLSKGWTQAVAANWYGVSTRQWRKYETGRASVPRALRLRAHEYDAMVKRIEALTYQLDLEEGRVLRLRHERDLLVQQISAKP